MTEEGEEDLGDETIIAETPRKTRSTTTEREVVDVGDETASDHSVGNNDAQAEPFVLPACEPDEGAAEVGSPEKVEREDLASTDTTGGGEDEAGNDSGIASSSPADGHTALGLSMPSMMPCEREPWQRILWKQQEGYDDDYVPDSFLSEERKRLEREPDRLFRRRL